MPHGDHAGHDHHAVPPDNFSGAFAVGTALNAIFVVAQVVFGFAAHSMAILADAAHNAGDTLGLALAWGAVVVSRRKPSVRHTYGFGRSSILAALLNAAVLLAGLGAIALGAVQRLVTPEPVASRLMIAVAAVGIAVNGSTALLLLHGRRGELNVRAAFLHMAADAAISAGVVVAGVVVFCTGWTMVDPVVGLAIAAFIGWSSARLLRDAAAMAMDAVPAGVDRDAVEAHLRALPGVVAIHDLHIWPLSTADTALTVHLVRPHAPPADDAFLHTLGATMRDRFGIGHATFQIECGDPLHPCTLASDAVV